MKTIVFQSFRTSDVPDWMTRCMASVRNWTDERGFDYEFIDDRFFDYAPDWYRQKVKGHKLLVGDLARLILARKFLAEGYARTIWIDADVIIFDPDSFNVEITGEFAFCRNTWIEVEKDGRLDLQSHINNAISVFCVGNKMLEFYIDACHAIVAHADGPLRHDHVGTRFLTQLTRAMPLEVLTSVGLFSPATTHDIVTGHGASLDAYAKSLPSPIQAANLCGSFLGKSYRGQYPMTDEIYAAVIDALVDTKGAIINDRSKRAED